MKKYLMILALSLVLAGCGKDKSARDQNEEETVETAVEAEPAAEEAAEKEPEEAPAEEVSEEPAEELAEAPAEEEKPADFNADLSTAKGSDKGSLDTISGRYNLSKNGEKYEGLEYVFMKDTYSVTETGTYSMSSGSIIMQHGAMPETTYKVEKADDGYKLTNDAGNMIPLTFKEGTDGLGGSATFEGTYSMSSSQGYIFHSDGKMETVNTDSFEIDGGTVKMGEEKYDWSKSSDGILISNNGTELYTLVPAE